MTLTQTTDEVAPLGRSAALWAGVLGAPLVWALQMEINYALAPEICATQMKLIAHLITLAGLILTLIGLFISWRDFRWSGGGSPDESDGGPIPRTRFLGALGMLVSGLVTIVVIAQGITSFFFDGCWL